MCEQNILAIINIENTGKYYDILIKCDLCFIGYEVAHCKVYGNWDHSCMFECCECKKICCHNCVIRLGNYNAYCCANCIQSCYIENCQNKPYSICEICKRPLCHDHSREKNNVPIYMHYPFDCIARKLPHTTFCEQNKSLGCAKYAMQNKK